MYEFTRTKKGNILKADFPHYAIRNLNGEDFLIFTDSSFYLKKLPFETKPRFVYKSILITAPKLGRSILVDKENMPNFAKYTVRKLDQMDYFKSLELTNDVMDELENELDHRTVEDKIAYIDSSNFTRFSNYELMKKEYGEIENREPEYVVVRSNSILDNKKKVGYFKVKEKGSYAITFSICNIDREVIGSSAIIDQEQRMNIRIIKNDERKWFEYDAKKWGDLDTIDKKLKDPANYLVEQGYL